VNLTCVLTNPPGGITAPSCTVTSSVTISGTTAATGTLTMVTTSSTTPGAYTMTVTGKDAATGLITSSTAVGLTVSVPPSIALTNSGANQLPGWSEHWRHGDDYHYAGGRIHRERGSDLRGDADGSGESGHLLRGDAGGYYRDHGWHFNGDGEHDADDNTRNLHGDSDGR